MVGALAGMFPAETTSRLLVGLQEPDDAAVYVLDGTGLVFTADYFPPVVDDGATYGAIAANNAMSDVFAMGGTPLMALNLATFPADMPPEVAASILRGAAEQVRAAGAIIAGGHSTTGDEPTFGLAVLGTVDPEAVIRKGGARVGDRLVLTKSLGVGVITTAGKQGTAQREAMEAAVASMLGSNGPAAAAARASGVRCGTDVTGFGLVGHGMELAQTSGVRLRVRSADLPLLPGALEHARAGTFPGGARRNAAYFGPQTEVGGGVDPLLRDLAFSPETSGGLLLAVPPARLAGLLGRAPGAVEIGVVEEGHGILLV